jgi:hypothetical protein
VNQFLPGGGQLRFDVFKHTPAAYRFAPGIKARITETFQSRVV